MLSFGWVSAAADGRAAAGQAAAAESTQDGTSASAPAQETEDALYEAAEVLDDFERSLDAAEELEENQDPASAYESLKGGVEMVFRKFRDTLENLGVEPIEAEGEPFDEHLHEAMMRQPSEEVEPGTVLQEIRYSRVVVAAEPSGQEAAEDEA